MKRTLLLLAALAAASFTHAADTPAAKEKSPADLAFDAARDAINSRTPESAKVLEAGFNLFFNFPEHSGVNGLLSAMGSTAGRLPAADRAGHTKAFNDRLAAELAKSDLKDSVRESILGAQASIEVSAQTRAATPDAAAVRAKIDALAARFPQSKALAGLDLGYAKLLAKADPAAGAAFLKNLTGSSNPETSRQAAGELRVAEMRTTPLEMKFTAADGREVDFAKLRGKVVLVDFWATWCGPCIAEIPNLTRVYNEYHAKGFEVIGISFENSSIIDEAALKIPRNAGKSLDTPEQIAEKKTKAKDKMLAFAKEKNMPWPQQFDGNYWENEYGRMYNIRGIPAMFLLDKEGKLIETSARGEKLEPLVKKLLGLDSASAAAGGGN
ncbi:MAG: TlpA family protein disulfide reductase [Opitutus sp.]|nr:TlpA family protein disulfide reductase [Opitutus sp.]